MARLLAFQICVPDHRDLEPGDRQVRALAPIYGTLVTSLLAMLLAVPISLGIAIFLTELAPSWMKRPVGVAIELLAAVPSIIFGIWGLFVLAPVLQRYVQPFLIEWLGPLPVIGKLFRVRHSVSVS